MSYNLSLKKRVIGNDINILDSQQVRYIRGALTIDASKVAVDEKGKKILKVGTFLGKITASGKYGPYDSAATDGRQTAVCILAETVDATEGDQVTTGMDHARVITARLPVAPTAEVRAQLKDITFV